MDITIPKNPEKGNPSTDSTGSPQASSGYVSPAIVRRFFVPVLIILLGIGFFGFWRVAMIEKNRPPVTVEVSTENLAGARSSLGATGVASTTFTTDEKAGGSYVAARGGTAYYYPWCPTAKRISEKNKVWFNSKEEAERAGYRPAKNCKGLQ